MKRFVKITQTFSVCAIMEIEEGETLESVRERIKKYCKSNDEVICCGGDISFEILKDRKPTKKDEISFECID